MHRSRLIVLGSILVASLAPTAHAVEGQADRVQLLVREGVALHDQGRYDEAVAKYRQALDLQPDNAEALHEMAYSFSAAGKPRECVAAAEAGLALKSRYQPILYTVAGNCLDEAGEVKKAVKTYRRGLKEYPDDALLAFNLAITLSGQQKVEEAIDLAKRAIDNAPTHASSHRLLGELFLDRGLAIPALLATLRFLTLEPSTDRSPPAARAVVALLSRGVAKKSGSEIAIALDPDPPTSEGDFRTAELILALAGALRHTEQAEGKTEIELYAESIDSLVQALPAPSANDRRNTWTWRTYVGFFVAARQAGHLEALTYTALGSLGLPGTDEWLARSSGKVDELSRWLSEHPRG